MTKEKQKVNKWEEKFDKKFPLPYHERMSKCDCRSDEEHEMHFRWFADPDRVKRFIRQVRKEAKKEERARIKKQITTSCYIDCQRVDKLLEMVENL